MVFFETEAPADTRPRDAIARARAFADGELDAAGEIRRRFIAGRAAQSVVSPAAVAATALGAAAYAAKAAGLAAPEQTAAIFDEISWQLNRLDPEARKALERLPQLGTDSAGPLGPGLFTSGVLGSVVAQIQAAIHSVP